MKQLSIIVAIAKNYAIGKDNKLLWHISDDLKRFKQLTTGNVIIMGKKTYESLPVKPLPNRTSIVITDIADETFENCITAYSIEDAIAKASAEKENFIIGGGSIYKQFMQHVSKLYLTTVDLSFNADTFFPEIDFSEWKTLEEETLESGGKNEFAHTYKVLERK